MRTIPHNPLLRTLQPTHNVCGMLLGAIDPSSPAGERGAAELRNPAEMDRALAGFDLHEGICQELAGTAALATALARQLELERPAESARAEQIAALIVQAAEKTRNVAVALAANMAGAKELHGALVDLKNSVGAVLPCRLEYPARVTLPLAASMHLYRIAHEAVRNAVAHSTASELTISFCADAESATLSVEDDGIGFRASDFPTRASGMWEMSQRARILHATLTIESMPGCGTRVSCVMPLQES